MPRLARLSCGVDAVYTTTDYCQASGPHGGESEKQLLPHFLR